MRVGAFADSPPWSPVTHSECPLPGELRRRQAELCVESRQQDRQRRCPPDACSPIRFPGSGISFTRCHSNGPPANLFLAPVFICMRIWRGGMEISREQMAGSGMPSDEEARAPWSTVACLGGGINQQSPAGLSWLFHIQGGLLVPGAKGRGACDPSVRAGGDGC